MKSALLAWLKYSIFALLVLASSALYLHGDAPLDLPNLVGYWVVAPALLGLLMMLFDVACDALSGTKSRGEWPS